MRQIARILLTNNFKKKYFSAIETGPVFEEIDFLVAPPASS